jgi:hypothetical protein
MPPGTDTEGGQPPGSSVNGGNVDQTQDAGDVGQAPADATPAEGETEPDLEAIREELRRRQESN